MNVIKMWMRFFAFLVCPRLYVTNTQSSQCAAIDSAAYDPLKPSEAHGRIRIAFFQATTLAAGGAIGDTYELCEIPINARVVGGLLVTEALGAGCTASIGPSGTAAKYASAVDVSAAAGTAFANTIALNYGQETTAKERLILTTAGAAAAASKKIWGHVLYVVD